MPGLPPMISLTYNAIDIKCLANMEHCPVNQCPIIEFKYCTKPVSYPCTAHFGGFPALTCPCKNNEGLLSSQ